MKLGIELSHNHPLLRDEKFLIDIREKIMSRGGGNIEADIANVSGYFLPYLIFSQATFRIDGSIEHLQKAIKQLAIKVI